MSDSTQLEVMQKPLVAAEVFRDVTSVQSILDKVSQEVTRLWQEIVPPGTEPDVSDPGVRTRIVSLAYKVTRSKTALDDLGKEHVADLKKQSNGIDGHRRMIRERLEALAGSTRATVTAWEAAEDCRVKKHDDGLAAINDLPLQCNPKSSASVQAAITILEQDFSTRVWEEFADRATMLISVTRDKLAVLYSEAKTYEEEQAELAQLRAAKLAADAKLAEEAENRRKLEAAQAAARAQEAAVADAARKAVEAEQKRVADELAEAEVKRAAVARQEAQDAADQRRREENLNHRRKHNRQAQESLAAVLDELPIASLDNTELARRIIEAIVLQRIKHVSIDYSYGA